MKGDETKRPPGYLKHKGSGQAYVLIDGRAAYLGVYGSPESRRRYSRAIAEWTAGTWTGRASGDPTVADLLAGWWRWAERHYLKRGRPTSEIGVAKGVVQILLDLYDDLPARDFGPACLRTVRAEMVRRGWCRTNVNRQVLRVRAIWRWGVAEEIVPGSVLPGLDAVRGLRRGASEAPERPRVRPVSETSVAAVQAAVPPVLAAMIEVQLRTGCRSGELVILRAGDLEMLREPETVWLYRPASDKSEHLDPATEKVVLLGPRAQEAIRPLLTADPAAWVFRLPAGRGSRGGPTAGGPRRRRKTGGRSGRTVGDRYTPDTYRRAVQRGCEQAGVATWHPHQLRHAFATEIRRVASLDAARVLLGHRFAETTEIYAEADRTGALDALRRLG